MFNLTFGTEDEKRPHSTIIAVAILLDVLTVTVNIPPIIVVLSRQVKKTNASNMHLLSLSVTDALVGVMRMAILLGNMFIAGNELSCCMVYFCFGVVYTNSLTNTAGIIIGRLSMVLQRKHLISRRRDLVLVILLCLIISIVLVSAGLNFVNCEYSLVVQRCTLDIWSTREFRSYIGIIYLFIETIIILSYVLLLKNLYTHFHKMKLLRLKSMPGHVKSKEWKIKSNFYKHELKSLITIGVMLVVFVVLSTPFYVELTLEGFGVVTDNLRLKMTILFSLASTNSMVNPIVFCLRVPEVKFAILQFYRRIMMKLRRNRIAPQKHLESRPRIIKINVQQYDE